ncbi:MAG: PDZ domain-containing protein [Nitrospira sp.]|nr:PDZ domain-containing protein [Nitrospira sp.]
MPPPATTLSLQETCQGRILLAALFALLLMIPIHGHAQQGLPPQGNPHGDLSDPMLPPPGIVGVALHLTAERIGDPAGLFIRATHPLGPAVKAGLAHGQEILAVDGQSVKGKTYREVVSMIRGEIGTSVTLLVKTFSDVKEVKIIRASEAQLTEEEQRI